MKYPIIGIHGPARSGKDTLAQFMIAASPSLYRYAFADPIRQMLAAGLGINMSDPYWVTHKETIIPLLGKSPRQLMQTLGTEWGRDLVNPDLWLILAQQFFMSHDRGMIITDTRFENEAKWIRDSGGVIVHISKPGSPTVNPHRTEYGIAKTPGDIVVCNDGSLEDLQIKARGVVYGA